MSDVSSKSAERLISVCVFNKAHRYLYQSFIKRKWTLDVYLPTGKMSSDKACCRQWKTEDKIFSALSCIIKRTGLNFTFTDNLKFSFASPAFLDCGRTQQLLEEDILSLTLSVSRTDAQWKRMTKPQLRLKTAYQKYTFCCSRPCIYWVWAPAGLRWK